MVNVVLHPSVTQFLVTYCRLVEVFGVNLRQGHLSAHPSSDTFVVTHVPNLANTKIMLRIDIYIYIYIIYVWFNCIWKE